jgi:hypothetical protein
MTRSLARFILAAALPLPAHAQSAGAPHAEHRATGTAVPALQATRLRESVRVDGVLDEDAWQAAQVARDFTQQSPRPGAPASLATEARVLVDDGAVYVAVRAHDPAPDSIVARLARRDVDVHSDWIHVALDSYGDRRSAYQFGVNAAGVKRDSRITDDTREDVSWDGVWDAATRIDEHGWTAELRIPLAQLRYRVDDAAASWGFNVRRVVARLAELSYWAPVPHNAGSYVSSFGELSGIHPERAPLGAELTPYLSSRVRHDPLRATNPYYRATDLALKAGADMRLNVASGLTVRATANPDFAQVEADPSSVNLTAYELVLPERRPFFVEGSEYLRSTGPTLFYSRRIGRAPQGSVRGATAVDMPEQATLLGAAKLTGQTGGWSIGVLDAVTAREHARYRNATGEHRAVVEPATNYTVARVARSFRQGRSGIGVIATALHRFLDDGEMPQLRTTAFAGGVDARHRFGGNSYEISGALLGSHVRGDTAAIAATQRAAGHYFQRPDAAHLDYDPTLRSLTGTALQARVARVGGGNWRAAMHAEYTSPAFEVNDLGQYTGADRTAYHATVRYIEPQPGRWFRRWAVAASGLSEQTTGGERIELNGMAELSATLHNHWTVTLWGMRHADGLRPDALRGGPALYNPARWMGSVDVSTDPRRAVSGSVGVFRDVLDQGSGDRLNLYGTLQLRPSARMDVHLLPSFGQYRHALQYVTRQNVAVESIYLLGTIEQRTASATIRLNYTFNPALSLQLYAQPYASEGSYSEFKRVTAQPRSSDPGTRYHVLDTRQLQAAPNADGVLIYTLDENADGTPELRWNDPSFDFTELRSSAVLRWEFRPGSTLFLVWTRERTGDTPPALSSSWPDARRMFRGAGPDALMLKVSYWLGS